jgi:hypothetical protein
MMGFLLILGMALSGLRLSAMTGDMDMSLSHASAAGMGHCGGCDNGPQHGKAMNCDAACMAPAVAILPPLLALTVERFGDQALPQRPLARSWVSSPIPHPPQPLAQR